MLAFAHICLRVYCKYTSTHIKLPSSLIISCLSIKPFSYIINIKIDLVLFLQQSLLRYAANAVIVLLPVGIGYNGFVVGRRFLLLYCCFNLGVDGWFAGVYALM